MTIGTLIVDDDEDIRFILRVIIEAANDGLFVAGEAASGREALDRINELRPRVVVLDEMMPGMTGLEAAALIHERNPEQIMILCTAYLDDDLRRRAGAAGIFACLTKEQMKDIPETMMRAVAVAG